MLRFIPAFCFESLSSGQEFYVLNSFCLLYFVWCRSWQHRVIENFSDNMATWGSFFSNKFSGNCR